MNDWTSVEDELPNPDTKLLKIKYKSVLVITKNKKIDLVPYFQDRGFVNTELLYMTDDEKLCEENHNFWQSDITHWMPLPKAPDN